MKNKAIVFLTSLLLIFQLASCNKSENNATSNGEIKNFEKSESLSVDFVREENKAVDTNGNANDTVVKDNIVTTNVNEFVVDYTEKDLMNGWDDDSTVITASDTGFLINGTGASSTGTTLMVNKAGTYVLSGNVSDGNICISSTDTKAVRLVFNGFSIKCSYDAPIKVIEADKVIITLADDTGNMVSYSQRDKTGADDEATGAVFCQSNLTFNGDGKLKVVSEFSDAIVSKDKLKIVSGNFEIKSADDGFVGRDLFAVKGGNIVINSTGDGIKSTYDKDAEKGQIFIEGGNIDITSEKDGIQSENFLIIKDGDINIVSGGGSQNGKAHNDKMMGGRKNGMYTQSQESTTQNDSTKGIKSSSDICIDGGNISIDSADDAIHSDTNVKINGGNISLASGDDGLHAEVTLDINGGNIDITKSYEGIEAQYININDGNINIVSTDDGFNASHQDRSAQTVLTFNGGTTYVDSAGDGLDSNGDIIINGGNIFVSGPVTDMNGALDSGDMNNEIIINGGTLIAAGSSGMFELPSEKSTQNVVAVSSMNIVPGTVCRLVDEKNELIAEYTIQKNSQALLISVPDIELNKTYTLGFSGTEEAEKTDDIVFEVKSVVTTFGEFGMMGGGFGRQQFGGGQKPGKQFGDVEMPEMPSFGDRKRPEMSSFGDGEFPETPFVDAQMPEI